MNIKVTHYNDYLYSALTGIKTLRIQTETQNKGQVDDTQQQAQNWHVVEKIMIIQALLRWNTVRQVYLIVVQERARLQHRTPVSECSSVSQFQCMSYYTRTQEKEKKHVHVSACAS